MSNGGRRTRAGWLGPMLWWLAAIVILYALFVGALYLFQRNLLYIPFGVPPEPAAAGVPEMSEVTLETADGLSLLAWWAPPGDPDGTAIAYFHGNAGHLGLRGPKVRPYLDSGYGVLLLAYRGYSGNPGRPTEAGLYADGRAALDFMAEAGIPLERTALYGESLGGGVAVRMAVERQVAALALEAPMNSVADVAQAHYPFVPARWLVKDRFDSAARIGEIEVPILVVHGERDTIVPERFVLRLFDAANEPKEIALLPDAGHNDLHEFGVAEVVLDFLARRVRGG